MNVALQKEMRLERKISKKDILKVIYDAEKELKIVHDTVSAYYSRHLAKHMLKQEKELKDLSEKLKNIKKKIAD
jgi:MOSC domain-containing protein YiiM